MCGWEDDCWWWGRQVIGRRVVLVGVWQANLLVFLVVITIRWRGVAWSWAVGSGSYQMIAGTLLFPTIIMLHYGSSYGSPILLVLIAVLAVSADSKQNYSLPRPLTCQSSTIFSSSASAWPNYRYCWVPLLLSSIFAGSSWTRSLQKKVL